MYILVVCSDFNNNDVFCGLVFSGSVLRVVDHLGGIIKMRIIFKYLLVVVRSTSGFWYVCEIVISIFICSLVQSQKHDSNITKQRGEYTEK